MSKQSKKTGKSMSGFFTIDMITPLQMEIIQAANDIGTDTAFTAQTILDAISPQEEPLTTEKMDLLLRRMMQTMVECNLNPVYNTKSKKSKHDGLTMSGRLLDLRGGQLSACGMEEETYVLSSLPIVLRYQHAIEKKSIDVVTTDMQGFVAMCEDEILGKN